MSDGGSRRLAFAVVLAMGFALGGCSSQIADMSSSDTQVHAKEPPGYLPVHDLPPARGEAMIPPDQRAKIEADLMAARDRQAAAAASNATPK